ncbi:acyl carrier protein [Paenibacillus sp. KS-LC4]|uniref:acyl carrier protein n=1 Tax=Paenibacillus sp. KS-LC4 TaxID=2979727 RepID=UPI0030D1096F
MSMSMQQEERYSTILSCVKQVLELNEEPGYDTDLSMLGLDSITTVNLIVALENEFDIIFENDDLVVDYFSTITQIDAIIAEKKGGR